ncbi:hypothetical protein JW930_03555 [Candidatus Woesearchaeota archaeon]|nr:hypothetical protein [Candidatus Woesearchaeota archaeon]
MVKIQQATDELRQIDDVLFDEFREVSQFEAELFTLEYELDEEQRLVAKLHNSCRTTIITIKHLHSFLRKMHKSREDKSVPVLKDMIKRQLANLDKDIDEIMSKMDQLFNDEKAGEKMVEYCKRVETILRNKIKTLKERFEAIEKS